ncbi:toll/interleukin-1 receptor domain-containing protein [Arthrobacter sp. 18067]|uniref:toll/interleukin-1 receptor domain-containing protein n=1 Tax=Arthrobacter sp. 18067 TaxID=2681413 RepID=UPI00135AD331|nr:toll/interleukin-1 receptor domain-containing protein [Arthrobacter sp. 18067]
MNQVLKQPTQRHAFISYVHEDKERVDRLQEALEAAGVAVWRDTKDLWPGQNWEDQIRSAIKSGSLAFIACFSENSEARETTYQNLELALAADEYRLRPPTTQWLLPVRFSECEVPDYDLGAGRRLSSIHRTDLFGSSETVQIIRLTETVKRIVAPQVLSEQPIAPAVAAGLAEARKADSPRAVRVQEIKELLRDPNGDIALEDLAADVAKPICTALKDPEIFPTSLPASLERSRIGVAKYYIGRIHEYDRVLEPLFRVVQLGAMYGLPQHEVVWTNLIEALGSTVHQRSGDPALLELRGYPVIVATHVAAMAAISRKNYVSLRAFAATPTVRTAAGKVPVALDYSPRRVFSEMQWVTSALVIAEDQRAEPDDALLEGLLRGSVGKRHTPLSDHLYRLLAPLFSDYVGDEMDYAELFEKAEVFLDLITADVAAVHPELYRSFYGGYGRYTWNHVRSPLPPEKALSAAFESSQKGWSPLLDGLFDGSAQRAQLAFSEVMSHAETVRKEQWRR